MDWAAEAERVRREVAARLPGAAATLSVGAGDAADAEAAVELFREAAPTAHRSLLDFYRRCAPFELRWAWRGRELGFARVRPLGALERVAEGGAAYLLFQELRYANALVELHTGAVHLLPLFEQCRGYALVRAFDDVEQLLRRQLAMRFVAGWELPLLGLPLTAEAREALLRLEPALLGELEGAAGPATGALDAAIRGAVKALNIKLE